MGVFLFFLSNVNNFENFQSIGSCKMPVRVVEENSCVHPKYSGVVCSIKESFGFIERADVVKEIFFHFSEVENLKDELGLGDQVEFVIRNRKGKEVACNISRVGATPAVAVKQGKVSAWKRYLDAAVRYAETATAKLRDTATPLETIRLGDGSTQVVVSTTWVPMTPWCVVGLGDGRDFHYNPSKGASSWKWPSPMPNVSVGAAAHNSDEQELVDVKTEVKRESDEDEQELVDVKTEVKTESDEGAVKI